MLTFFIYEKNDFRIQLVKTNADVKCAVMKQVKRLRTRVFLAGLRHMLHRRKEWANEGGYWFEVNNAYSDICWNNIY